MITACVLLALAYVFAGLSIALWSDSRAFYPTVRDRVLFFGLILVSWIPLLIFVCSIRVLSKSHCAVMALCAASVLVVGCTPMQSVVTRAKSLGVGVYGTISGKEVCICLGQTETHDEVATIKASPSLTVIERVPVPAVSGK